MAKPVGFVPLKVRLLHTDLSHNSLNLRSMYILLRIQFIFVTGIINARFIANIVPDGRFSAASISASTQVVMMDEWTADSLSCEDAKRILQGISILFT